MSKTKTYTARVVRPKQLSTNDMPKTPGLLAGGLRSALVRAFNTCRIKQNKLDALYITLVYMVERCKMLYAESAMSKLNTVMYDAKQCASTKELDEFAKKYNIDIDGRTKLEDALAFFEDKITEALMASIEKRLPELELMAVPVPKRAHINKAGYATDGSVPKNAANAKGAPGSAVSSQAPQSVKDAEAAIESQEGEQTPTEGTQSTEQTETK